MTNTYVLTTPFTCLLGTYVSFIRIGSHLLRNDAHPRESRYSCRDMGLAADLIFIITFFAGKP